MARPSIFTQKLADSICDGLASGLSLSAHCQDLGISIKTVMLWLSDPRKEQFRKQYARAREIQADFIAEEILDIADDLKDDPNSRRVRIDARKWFAGKLRPKKYGEASQVDINLGGQFNTPIEISLSLSPDEAYRQMLGKSA